MKGDALNRIPGATYRVQFHHGFTFEQAKEIVDYLAKLGISDLYASPIFTAGPNSTHGYDICDFNEINPQLGSLHAFEQLTSELRGRGMGLLLDMVPNHMGAYESNAWWTDVLRNGPASRFAAYFDIDWNSANPSLKGKILLPVLGGRYAQVLERGELKLSFASGAFEIAYFENKFPLSPESSRDLGPASITQQDAEKILRAHNDPGAVDAVDRLDQLIQRQHYRLAYWRVGSHEINYRRFFDVTKLAALRVEDPKVFEAIHHEVFRLLRSGKITGLRIDHPDGLRDPKTYLERLQDGFHEAGGNGRLYVVAEKILSDGEHLPPDWAVEGTTGYDFLNCVNGVFIEQHAEGKFSEYYKQISGEAGGYEQAAIRGKREVLSTMFASEVDSLTNRLEFLARRSREGRDFTRAELFEAIIEFIAHFPVYRTYRPLGDAAPNSSLGTLSSPERSFIQTALEKSSGAHPALSECLTFLANILRLKPPRDLLPKHRGELLEFTARFQQLSGPATAKGLEDTAFYRFARFISLNEVGGDPGKFGTSLDEFHSRNSHMQRDWPHSLLATATHDTKRGEDVRARLNVLSEIPERWTAAVDEWRGLNAEHRTTDGNSAPDASDEYFIYQTLLGAWPMNSQSLPADFSERIKTYMQKALREAKRHTTWTDTNEHYESATAGFVDRILASTRFLESFRPVVEHCAFFGVFNSLAQVLLKICSPGVPDFYQGTELWDLSLVDPDNRRPVDYKLRKAALEKVLSAVESGRLAAAKALAKAPLSPELKLFTIHAALQFRHSNPALFSGGKYEALQAKGEKDRHVIALSRHLGNQTMIAVVPRFCSELAGGELHAPTRPESWGGTSVETNHPGPLRNIFTDERLEGGTLRLGNIFASFPVAMLSST